MERTINILMDDRERSGVVFEHLAAMDEISINIRRLPVGDFRVDDRLLFERKTLKDFSISVIDGRFFKQMTQLASSQLKGVLILEGTSRDLVSSGVRREALQGALIITGLIMGIPVLRAVDPEETARLMVYAARQISFIIKGGIQRSGYRPKGKRQRQLFILQGLPGVGAKRAEQLIDRFGSVRNVMNAGVEELLSVEGIGEQTARQIKWAVGEPMISYGENTGLMLDI